MKKIITLFILLTIPLLLWYFCLRLQADSGDYYARNRYDPSYAYLLNSLNLAQMNGYEVGHLDHPGTPVQLIGAFTIKIIQIVNHKENIVHDVLTEPEMYLRYINIILFSLISLCIFLIGFVVNSVYKNIYLAVFFQLTPFLSVLSLWYFNGVSPDPLMISISLLFITLILVFLKEYNEKDQFKYILLFSIIIGLGISAKIIFFPLAIIPFIIIKGFKNKILLVILSFISFLIFISPAMSIENNDYFLSWVSNLATHSGAYGGEQEFLDFPTFVINLKLLISAEPIFFTVFFLIITVLLLRIVPKFNRLLKNCTHYKLLLGIFLAMSLQVFSVSKNFSSSGQRYLLASLMLITLGIFTSISILTIILPTIFSKKRIKFTYVLLVLILTYFSFEYAYSMYYGAFEYGNEESLKFIKYVKENYPEDLKIFTYGVSSEEFALSSAIELTRNQMYDYFNEICERFPNSVIYRFKGFIPPFFSVCDGKNLYELFHNKKKLIFLTTDETLVTDFIFILNEKYNIQNVNYKFIFKNELDESIYEINIE